MNNRKNNTGTYRKNKSGSYELAIQIGYIDNKRIRKYKTAYVSSDNEAEIELYNFLKEYENEKINDKDDFFRKKGIKYLEINNKK
jgi:ABC-type uncharacterized transport system auxiliary subunit